MKDDIKFLKDLQAELKNQDNDCQAAPRFWTVGDYRMRNCSEGFQEEYHIAAPNQECYQEIDSLLKEIETEELEDMSDDAKEAFSDIECEESGLDWIKEYYDEDAELIPMTEEHFIRENTMFLTKAEAKRHIELNHYNYSKKAHTYAMTAWRAPKVERLLNILENFQWDGLNIVEEDVK